MLSRMFQVLFFTLLTLLLAACGGQQAQEEESESASEDSYAAAEAPAESANRGTAEATIGGADVTIDYGRPTLVEGKIKDQNATPRDARAGASAGYVWRVGMNEATTIETSSPLQFGETTLPAGEYTMFARKTGESEWELVFNSQLGQWGAFSHDPSQDVATAPLSINSVEQPVEQLEIAVEEAGENGGAIVIRWGQDEMKSEFTVPQQ